MKKSLPLLGLFGVFCAVSSFSLANQEDIVSLGGEYHLSYTSSRNAEKNADVLDIRVYKKGTLIQTIEEEFLLSSSSSSRSFIQAKDVNQDGKMDFVVTGATASAENQSSVYLFDPMSQTFRRNAEVVSIGAQGG